MKVLLGSCRTAVVYVVLWVWLPGLPRHSLQPFLHAFVHSLIHGAVIDCLPCARNCLGYGDIQKTKEIKLYCCPGTDAPEDMEGVV